MFVFFKKIHAEQKDFNFAQKYSLLEKAKLYIKIIIRLTRYSNNLKSHMAQNFVKTIHCELLCFMRVVQLSQTLQNINQYHGDSIENGGGQAYFLLNSKME